METEAKKIRCVRSSLVLYVYVVKLFFRKVIMGAAALDVCVYIRRLGSALIPN